MRIERITTVDGAVTSHEIETIRAESPLEGALNEHGDDLLTAPPIKERKKTKPKGTFTALEVWEEFQRNPEAVFDYSSWYFAASGPDHVYMNCWDDDCCEDTLTKEHFLATYKDDAFTKRKE